MLCTVDAEFTVELSLLIAKFNHAGCDDYFCTVKGAENFKSRLCAGWVCVESIINNCNIAAVNHLKSVRYTFKTFNSQDEVGFFNTQAI